VAGFDARSAWRDDPLERRIRDEWDTNELRREGFRGFGFHFAVLPVFDFEDVDPLLSERVVRDGIAVQHEHTVRPLSNPELRRWFLDRKAPSRSTIDDGLALVEFLARIPGRIEERGGRRSDRGSQKIGRASCREGGESS